MILGLKYGDNMQSVINGIIEGPSHKEGGVQLCKQGQFIAEVEGGEGVIAKKHMNNPHVRRMVQALVDGKVAFEKLADAIIKDGSPLVPSTYLEDGGEADDGIDDDDTAPEEAKFTQSEFDAQIQLRLNKQKKAMSKDFGTQIETKIAESLAAAKAEWEDSLKTKDDDRKKGEWDDATKEIVKQEQRKWQASYDADTSSRDSVIAELQEKLEGTNGKYDALKKNQKVSLIKSAMMEGKISDKFIGRLMPGLKDHVIWNDDIQDFAILENADDPESVRFNPKDKDKGIYAASDYIANVWAQDADLKMFRTDFKPGPGSPGNRTGESSPGGKVRGTSRIARGLKNATA